MIGPFLLLVTLLPPDAYLPCTPGLELTYGIERDGADTGTRVVDRIREAKESRLCIVDRTTTGTNATSHREAYAREHLDDRILLAGWLPHLVAFRMPLLRAPLRTGAKWRFGAVEYRVVDADAEVTVGGSQHDHALVIVERALDHSGYRARSIYAPGVGLIHRAEGSVVRFLISVDRSRKRQLKQSFKPRDGPSGGVVSPSAEP